MLKPNARQRIFIAHYLKHQNATEAAWAAGYGGKRKDKKARAAARAGGCLLLTKPHIRKAIDAGMARLLKKADVSAERVIEEIGKLAFVKITDAFADDGTLLEFKNMPEDVKCALNSVETEELFAGRGPTRQKIGLARKIKISDKVRSLEILAKHYKLLTDVHELNPGAGGPAVVLTMPANGSEAPKPEKPEGES